MRFPLLLALLLALCQAAPSLAQSPPTASAPPAKASPIIPGSPLAALASAVPETPPDNADAAPFGTNSLGFSIANAVGAEVEQSMGSLSKALYRSTRLTPVLVWLQNLLSSPKRLADAMAIGLGLLLALLPALLAELALRALLRRATALCQRYAKPPGEEAPPEEEQGLADAEAGELEKPVGRGISARAWLRRCAFALLHFILRVLPLFGFAVVLELLLSHGVPQSRAAHLALTGIGNAYLACRLAQEVARLLIAPSAPELRLISMPAARAQATMRRVVLLLATGFTAYGLIATAEVLGLPQDGAAALARLAALAVHIELAISIWQSRKVVGGWISGPPDAQGVRAALRQRLGRVWHYLALFYVLALWVALASGVPNAFLVLLRVVLVLAAALILGRLAWIGSQTLLDRILPDPSRPDVRHPLLAARARAYNPFIRFFIRLVIGVFMLLLVLQGWGINVFGTLFTNPLSRGLLSALSSLFITIAVGVILWEAANFLLHQRLERLTAEGRSRQAARLRTLMPLLRATIGAVILLACFFFGLSEIGVNATGLLAVSGVAGIAVGFGSQKLVQDVITGLFLLLEDAMQVGDYVSLGGLSGTVERLSIRTIRLRGADGSVNIIPFSSVGTVTNMTRDFSFAQISITVGYSENIDRVFAVLREIAQEMRADKKWGDMIRDDLQIFGLDEFGQLGLVVTGQIRTGPGQHWAVRREFYARVVKRFAAEGIEIPYNRQALLGLAAQG